MRVEVAIDFGEPRTNSATDDDGADAAKAVEPMHHGDRLLTARKAVSAVGALYPEKGETAASMPRCVR